jgi:hypothetical protein
VNQPRPRRGWTLLCEEGPATDIEAMPQPFKGLVINFLTALAVEAGAAIDAGTTPPGHPLDELGIRYSIVVTDEPVIVEYVVMRDDRELRVPTLVWIH